MKTRLAPILCKECKTLKWEIKGKPSGRTALLELLSAIAEIEETLKENKLAPKNHIAKKEKLKKAIEEVGVSLLACKMLRNALQEKWAVEKEAALQEKSDVQLLRELLKLAQNEPKLRAKSHQFEEAWPEVETRYFAKMSLYRAELAKKE